MSELMDKPALRQQLKLALRTLAPEQREALSAAAADRVLSAPEYRRARSIMLFLSLPSEIDTSPVAHHAWTTGRRVLVPRVRMEDRSMQAIEIRSFEQDLQQTKIGVMEPIGGEGVRPEEIDLILVPGLGFGPQGQRLGRGAGFYDRFLANPGLHAVTCGYGFEMQVIEGIPMADYDTRIGMLITDAQVRRFRL